MTLKDSSERLYLKLKHGRLFGREKQCEEIAQKYYIFKTELTDLNHK